MNVVSSTESIELEFVTQFKEKMKKVENFLNGTLENLNHDFLIIQNHENENKPRDFITISNEESEKDEEIMKISFKKLYEMICWAENFCIINSIASHKIIKKYKKNHKILNRLDIQAFQIDKMDHDYASIFKKIISNEKELKNEILKLYATRYTNENLKKAKRQLDKIIAPHLETTDKILIILFVFIFIVLISSYFLLTHLPGIK